MTIQCKAPFCERTSDLRKGLCWNHQTDNNKQPCNTPFCENIRHPRKGYCPKHAYEFEKYKIKAYKELIPIGFYVRCKLHGLLSKRKDVGKDTNRPGSPKRFKCNKCSNEKSKIRRLINPDKELKKHRKQNLKRKYGLSIECFKKITEAQNDSCSICKKKESAINHITKNIRALSVDHCHISGKVRGLLCSKCNFGIGYFDDSIGNLHEAIKYLQHHKDEQV